MTGTAIYLSMRSMQVITGKGVVKSFSIEANHLKFSSMMIAVAFNTPFPLYIRRGVISPAFSNSDSDIQVTIQAFFSGNFLPKGVAFGAIRKALQVGMWLRKITR